MTEKYFPLADRHGLQSSTIEAGNSTLLKQAPMTADEYLASAISCIDDKLGNGYAKAHPELVAAFIQTSAMDLGAAVVARAIETLATAVRQKNEE
jgi:hypothetical protein